MRISPIYRIQLVALFMLFNSFSIVRSQTFFGLQNSNYAGVNAIYSNPALVTNMSHQRSANIGGLGINIDNNYVALETPFSFWELVNNNVDDQYKDDNGRIKWDKNWIKEDPTVSNIRLNIGTEYRGPSYVNTYGRIMEPRRNEICMGERTGSGPNTTPTLAAVPCGKSMLACVPACSQVS